MIPEWAVPGAKCICIVGAWKVFGEVVIGAYPVVDGEYTVARVHVFAGECWLILAEQDIKPGYYQASAFRPVKTIDDDVALFAGLLKGASASTRRREPEPA